MAQDSLNRQYDTNNASGQAFAKALLQALPAAMPVAVKQTPEFEQKQQELIDSIQSVEEAIQTQTETIKNELDQHRIVLNEINNIRSTRSTRKPTSTVSGSQIGDPNVSLEKSVNDSIRKAAKSGKVPGLMGGGAGGGGGGKPPITSVSGAGGGGGGFGPTDASKFMKGLGLSNIGTMLAASVGYGLASAMDTFINNTGVQLSGVFDGLIREEFEFMSQMKKAVNETRGFGKELENITDQYLHFGDVVAETGKNRTEFQMAFIKNARKGLGYEIRAGKLVQKTAKDQIRMLKNALNVSFELDMNAQATAEMFDQWSRGLQLSNTQLYSIGLSMKQIARETGVSGENMMEVAKSVEETARLLKKSAGLSESTMAAMLRSASLATKFGIEDINKQIDQGLVSFEHFLNMSDQGLQAFMARALHRHRDLWRALQAGVAGAEEYRPRINAAFTEEIQRVMAQVGMGGVDPKNVVSEMRKLELQLMQAEQAGNQGLADNISSRLLTLRTIPKLLGMEIGDFNALVLKMEEESKTPIMRIEELNAELAKATNDVRRESLLADIGELRSAISQKAIATFTEIANIQGTTIEEAMGLTKAKLIEGGYLKENDPFGAEQFRKVVTDNLTHLESEAKRLGGVDFQKELQLQNFDSTNQVLDAMFSADVKDRMRAQSFMEQVSNKIGVDQSVEDNPVAQINKNVAEINEMLRTLTGAFIFNLTATTLAGIIAAAVGLKSAGMVVGGIQMFRGFNRLMAGKGLVNTAKASSMAAGAKGYLAGPISTKTYELGHAARGGIANATSKLTRATSNLGKLVPTWNGLLRGLISIFEYGYKGMRAGATLWWNWVKLVGTHIAKTGTYLTKITAVFSGLLGRLTQIGTAIKNINLASVFAGLKKGLGGLKLIFSPKAIFGYAKAGGLLKTLGLVGAKQGVKAAAGVSTGGIALAVFAAIEGAMGAWKGYKDTADVFAMSLKNVDGTMKEATMGMKAASTAAGFVSGALDSVTFGLLSLTGLKAPLQKTLSHLYYTMINPIENLISGFKKGFMEAWAYIKPAFDEAWKSFEKIGEVFNVMWVDIGKMFGIDDIKGGFDFLNKVWEKTGPFFKEVGSWLGFAFGVSLKGLIPWIKLAAEVVFSLANVVAGVVRVVTGLVGVMTNLFRVMKGIITLDFDYALQAFKNLGNSIVGVFGGIGQALLGVLGTIYHSTIGVVLTAFRSFLNIFDGFGETVAEWLSTLPSMIWSGMKDAGNSLLTSVKSIITEKVPVAFSTVGQMFMDAASSIFVDFPTMVYNGLKSALDDAWTWFKSKIPGVGLASGAIKGAKNVYEKAKSSKFNPMNWFDQGTREIQNTGVAVVHEGEAIFPRSIWDTLKAVGSGAFGSSTVVNDVVKNPTTDVGTINRGAFAEGEVKEALIPQSVEQKDPVTTFIDAVKDAYSTNASRAKSVLGLQDSPIETIVKQLKDIKSLLEMLVKASGNGAAGLIKATVEAIHSNYVERGAFEGSKLVKEAQEDSIREKLVSVNEKVSEIGKQKEKERTIDSSYVGLGAFSNRLVKEVGVMSSINNVNNNVINASEQRVREEELKNVRSSVINMGAFGDKSVSEAYDYDDLQTRVSAVSSKDYNNVLESIKQSIVSKPQGGATRALYITDNGTIDEINNNQAAREDIIADGSIGGLDRELFRAYSSIEKRSVAAGTSMFTPEDAADYIMQQMAGSAPSTTQSLAGVEFLTQLAEERNMTLSKILYLLENAETQRQTNSNTLLPGSASVKEGKGENPISGYQRELLRGNWPDLQAVAANGQDRLMSRRT